MSKGGGKTNSEAFLAAYFDSAQADDEPSLADAMGLPQPPFVSSECRAPQSCDGCEQKKVGHFVAEPDWLNKPNKQEWHGTKTGRKKKAFK